MMHELLTTLGEGRAFVNIYSMAHEPRPSTRKRYLSEYRRYLQGIVPEEAPSLAAGMWAMAGVRFGALERMKAAVPALEVAVKAGDQVTAEAAAAEVEACLEVFRKYPPHPLGRRVRKYKEQAPRVKELSPCG